ncbi:unnamed protein product [Cylicostephanus goldi]|uniref:Uncharacterized protein n=1 Tax=Cylicostephanus goldi TaxID=71465 RepID=A0A3P7MD71_CYLGO|nr:unnamed protein product [Cylicostephanus goldi]
MNRLWRSFDGLGKCKKSTPVSRAGPAKLLRKELDEQINVGRAQIRLPPPSPRRAATVALRRFARRGKKGQDQDM